MRLALLAFFLLTACRDPGPAEGGEAAQSQQSACATRLFEQSRFIVCSARGGRIEIVTAPSGAAPYRSFSALESSLGARASRVVFAMNAGMFDEEGRAIGLLIENGKKLHAINRRKGGGNFHLLPNGVFLVRRDGSAEVVTSEKFKPAADISFATQSGPMLLIDGKLHPRFEPDGQSRNIRNGVGIGPDGTPLFVISADLVSFGKLARFYRDALGVKDALYFDGSVSSLWDPANGRMDSHAPLGPMVVVFRAAASAPGREGRATP